MALFLTNQAKLICKHVTGVVQIFTLQRTVFIQNEPVLVENDPEKKMILGCCNASVTIKPCTLTINVKQGYSEFIYINGRRVCLDTVVGLTDGTVPGTVDYVVRHPGQRFVNGVS